ncbi:ribosome biogenesis protein Noc4 [Coccidioides immitis RS]|uniref:Ribosome biogenesis protein Noc4 n=3 Tax=Coccidioides immitis TaxID=5501 RepID=A0A0E1RX11_COCIM|nr:ribosome biogenesis protein Noc4 [Coccidioides immitis RS]EAS33295.2 ribosome biogenesis protein Noc4 [Coccidioides immitis RS]KMP04452.1 nucleolar complex protein 4 [Coccidioides immitis RMSCC 2394]TPX21057.1 hypothetical protein DIZ76_015010 [Coccidioides immitis]
MSDSINAIHIPKKRKKHGKGSTSIANKRRATGNIEDAERETIQQLEEQISESRKYYNNIATLLSMLNVDRPNLAVAISICRVFCRLLAGGHLNKQKGASEQHSILVAWLRERYQEYQKALITILRHSGPSSQAAAVSLCMRLAKEHSTHYAGGQNNVWDDGYFNDVVTALIEADDGDQARAEFTRKYLKEYHDISVFTVLRLSNYLSVKPSAIALTNVIYFLSELGTPPTTNQTFENFYTDISKASQKVKGPLMSVNSYKQRVQSAWLLVLLNGRERSVRKRLLQMMTHEIAPWFMKPELLMDFLTDSYNQGGSISLLSLSGLFYLIQNKNLDYPQFYPKLYSLLDPDLLHSKHRSRFFRLLDTFLSSTHLPATLVASFIKRLSRLALNAPPAAIVAVVPWIYNLLKSHPSCTFMVHRALRDESLRAKIDAEGIDDPFDPLESDPTLTDAIESSLWEIEMLQSHYHPNVAALAKIISEQFTKQMYNLEDFLDHSYQALIVAELGNEEKQFKKPPVVEFQIPKRIFTDRLLEEDGGNDTELGNIFRQLWNFE